MDAFAVAVGREPEGVVGRIGCAYGRRLGLKAVVEQVFIAHGVVKRVGVPQAVDEVVVVRPLALEYATPHCDGCAGKVAM